MRLGRTLRNKHTGGDFGVRIAFRSQHYGLTLAVGQYVEQCARRQAMQSGPVSGIACGVARGIMQK